MIWYDMSKYHIICTTTSVVLQPQTCASKARHSELPLYQEKYDEIDYEREVARQLGPKPQDAYQAVPQEKSSNFF